MSTRDVIAHADATIARLARRIAERGPVAPVPLNDRERAITEAAAYLADEHAAPFALAPVDEPAMPDWTPVVDTKDKLDALFGTDDGRLPSQPPSIAPARQRAAQERHALGLRHDEIPRVAYAGAWHRGGARLHTALWRAAMFEMGARESDELFRHALKSGASMRSLVALFEACEADWQRADEAAMRGLK